MGVGLFYVVAFVIGVYRDGQPDDPLDARLGDAENFNHLVNGVLLLAIGLISSGQTQALMKRQGLA